MKTYKRFMALMLICVMVSGLCAPAYAANSLGVTYTAQLDSSTLNVSSSEQTVTMTVKTNQNVNVDGIQFNTVIPEGWSVESIKHDTLTFDTDEVNLTNGKLVYSSADGENDSVQQIAKITYKVPANTPAGTYNLGINEMVLSSDHGTVWERGGAASATLKVSENAGKIIVKEAKCRAGETVDVVISMEKNPGLVTLVLNVEYNSDIMTLSSVTDAGILGEATHSPDYTLCPYQLTWNNGTATSDFTSTGDIVTLKFTISEDAEDGVYPITLNYSVDETMNYDMDSVDFVTVGSSITISSVVFGDVNSDGIVNMKDSVLLSRYVAKWPGYDATNVDLAAADVNEDGSINMKDSVILSRYVAKWPGYDTLPYK